MKYKITARDTVLQPAKELAVRKNCDVLVVGGGTSGCMAAIAAARNGASTVLIERYGALGGEMINGAVALHSFFNSFVHFPEAGEKKIVEGIPQELVDRVCAAGGSPGHIRVDPVYGGKQDPYCTSLDHEVVKAVLAQMMEEAGVHVLLHAMVTDIIMEENSIRGVVIESKSGREAILCDICIDCSGDGDVAHMAGVPESELYSQYAIGFTFGIGGVDMKRAAAYLDETGQWLAKGHGNKNGPGYEDVVRFGFTMTNKPSRLFEFQPVGTPRNYKNVEGCIGVSLHENELSYVNYFGFGRSDLNPTDVEDLTECEMYMRRKVVEIAAYLRENAPGFEHCYISWTSQQVCPRASRTFHTVFELSNDDICEARKFDDEFGYSGFHDLAQAGYPIKNGGYVGLPYRMLLPIGIDNLLLAGRMVTTEKKAHQCTRIGVACMQMGQAAGTAAALCSCKTILPKDLDYVLLKSTLRKDGVYLEDRVEC